MKTLDSKVWDKARPKLVEKTGIGKAIEKALKVCPIGHDLEKVKELDQFKEVGKAITDLKAALKEGLSQIADKGKDKKAKPEEFKKAKSLLEGWQKEVEEYAQAVLESQRRIYQRAMDQAQGKGENKDALVAAEREYYTTIRDNLEKDIEKLKEHTGKAETAIQKNDAKMAGLSIQILRKSIESSERLGGKKGLIKERKKYADKHKVAEKDITLPPFAPALHKEAQSYAKKVEDLQNQIDGLMESAAATVDPGKVTKPNKEYEKALKEAIAAYKDIAATVKKALGPAQQLSSQSARLLAMPADPKIPSKKIADAAQLFNSKFMDWSKVVVGQLDLTRSKGSPVRAKIVKAGLTEEDDKAYLAPIMDATYNSNNRMIAAGKTLERNVRDALESLVELRPTDSGDADAELKRMAGNTYRVVGTSVGG